MRIREYTSPRPHVVVDDVLAREELAGFLEHLRGLEPRMTVGMVRKRAGFEKSKVKDNRVLFVDDQDEDPHARAVMDTLRAHAWSDAVLDFLEDADAPLFQVLQYTEAPSIQISRYVTDGHYGFHRDIGNKTNLTVLFFACVEPQGFTGGNFVMEHRGKRKTLPYRSNRLLIFPSSTLHRVTPVKAADDSFEAARFSLQIWPAIAPGKTKGPRSMQILRREDQARHPLKPSFAVPPADQTGSAAFYRAFFSGETLPVDQLDLSGFGRLGGRLFSNLGFVANSLYPAGKFRQCFHNEHTGGSGPQTSLYLSSGEDERIELGYRLGTNQGFRSLQAELFVRLQLPGDTIERAKKISLKASGTQLEERLVSLIGECLAQSQALPAHLGFLAQTT